MASSIFARQNRCGDLIDPVAVHGAWLSGNLLPDGSPANACRLGLAPPNEPGWQSSKATRSFEQGQSDRQAGRQQSLYHWRGTGQRYSSVSIGFRSSITNPILSWDFSRPKLRGERFGTTCRVRSKRKRPGHRSAPEFNGLSASGNGLRRLDLQKLAGACDRDRPRLHRLWNLAHEVDV
jgi:hypothetical protein